MQSNAHRYMFAYINMICGQMVIYVLEVLGMLLSLCAWHGWCTGSGCSFLYPFFTSQF